MEADPAKCSGATELLTKLATAVSWKAMRACMGQLNVSIKKAAELRSEELRRAKVEGIRKGKLKGITRSSNQGLQQHGSRRPPDSGHRSVKRRRSSSSDRGSQQRGGRRYDSSLVGDTPTPPGEPNSGESGAVAAMSSSGSGGRQFDSSPVGGEEGEEIGIGEEEVIWSINAYDGRRVLHIICARSDLPLCRASRSSASPLAQPVASGRGLQDLRVVGELSGEFCRRCECRCSSDTVRRVRSAVVA